MFIIPPVLDAAEPKMMEAIKLLDTLEKGSVDECKALLECFNTENERARSIDWLAFEEKAKLWANIFTRLNDTTGNAEIIIHREKNTLENVITEDYIKCLLRCSGLQFGFPRDPNIGPAECLNGMKVIFNMIFQSEKLQNMFITHKLLDALIMHVRPDDEAPLENQYFMLKTFFIITALAKKTGAIVRNDLNGIEVIVNYIDKMGNTTAPYDKLVADVICEALKVLYNIIHNIFPSNTELTAEIFDSKDFTLLCKMCRLIRRNLLHHVATSEKKLEVDCHSIHLLTVVPPECYDELLIDEESEASDNQPVPIIFEGKDLTAIDCILNVLNIKLGITDRAPAEPLLVVCCKMARKNRFIRRYLKHRILPPLRKQDVIQRPEVGHSLRNKLCVLIHTPAGCATEVSATLLFTLCKENATKLVKYTGYGNAAGLLADRGLMLGGRGDGVYSEDSDSDSEEYNEVRDQINSIEGWMKPEPQSLEMTEEQKEFEAMKLVETIDKLASSKTIQPCRIGPDGKPQPIGSVLELQEAMESSIKTSPRLTGSDTDSD
ncbi:Synembryn-A [Orchesella cincta]|uniref:Synembryn-A n=1 Tax=Orchesella cincta TaxID=48709 RepID=A0A1D2MLW3_ORCCI|nr:Synembryn-A [Orchesella cincta]